MNINVHCVRVWRESVSGYTLSIFKGLLQYVCWLPLFSCDFHDNQSLTDYGFSSILSSPPSLISARLEQKHCEQLEHEYKEIESLKSKSDVYLMVYEIVLI